MITDCTVGNGKKNITGDKSLAAEFSGVEEFSFSLSRLSLQLAFMNENFYYHRECTERVRANIFQSHLRVFLVHDSNLYLEFLPRLPKKRR